MKQNYFEIKISLIIFIILLSSCSLIQKESYLNNHNCSKETFIQLQPIISETSGEYLNCIKTNAKHIDSKVLNEIFRFENKNFNLRCDIKSAHYTVLAEKKDSRFFPGLNFNSVAIKTKPNSYVKNEVFHEFSHLIDQGHYRGFDLAELADQCCLNSKVSELTKKQACRLMAMPLSSWVTKEYLVEFSKITRDTGKPSLAYKTILGSGIENRKNTKQESFHMVINENLKILDELFVKKSLTRSEKRTILADQNLYYHFIFNMYLGLSTIETHLTSSAKRLEKLRNLYFSNQIDRSKILLFGDIAEIMSSLLNNEPEKFSFVWSRFKDRTVYNCRHLDPVQLEAINSILNQLNPIIFDYKNDINAGDFYEIATYFSNPCGYGASLKSQ